jgi:hypothetical protein
MTQQQEATGAVRIGNGAKLHPAVKDAHYGLIIRCCCPGTKQGGAYKAAKFLPGVSATCKN